MTRLALGLTQPPIQWVPAALSLGVKWPGCDPLTSIQCCGKRMCGAIPTLLQYASMAWCSVEAWGQLYLHLTFSLISTHCLKFCMCVVGSLPTSVSEEDKMFSSCFYRFYKPPVFYCSFLVNNQLYLLILSVD
jgi:hypothetical protein